MENKKHQMSKKQITLILTIIGVLMGGEMAFLEPIIEKSVKEFVIDEIKKQPINEHDSFVGFFLDKRGRLMFKHVDSYSYTPIFDNSTKRYFFQTTSGEVVWCY